MILKAGRGHAPLVWALHRWVFGIGLQVPTMQAGALNVVAPLAARDVISRPPSPRHFVSPSGRVRLMLQLAVPERPPRVPALRATGPVYGRVAENHLAQLWLLLCQWQRADALLAAVDLSGDPTNATALRRGVLRARLARWRGVQLDETLAVTLATTLSDALAKADRLTTRVMWGR